MPKTKRPPLPIPIPTDLAGELGYDPSFISHWNAGRKPIPIKAILKVMEIAAQDERLAGISILHLLPEIKPIMPFICAICPKTGKKITRKRTAKGAE